MKDFHTEVFQHSPDAIFIEDYTGRILEANDAACAMHGVVSGALKGCNVFDLVPPEAREIVRRDYQKWFTREMDRYEGLSFSTDGRRIPVEIRGSHITYQSKPALLLHVRNITQRKELEARLIQSQKMESLGKMAGGIAHDFNNLLMIISGSAAFIQDQAQPGSSILADTQQIIRASDHATTLVRQLLAFSRRQPLALQNLELNEWVSGMRDMFGRLLGETVSLAFQPSRQPLVVTGDSAHLTQTLLNLLINARDAMPAGGEICMRIEAVRMERENLSGFVERPEHPEGPFAALRIRDTGFGMTEEVLSQIFDPFFTTKPHGKGTGLGLSTALGIIRQHGGFVSAKSLPGEGSTFSIYLPLAPMAAASPQATLEPSAPGRGETLLLVEDDSGVRHIEARLLTQLGYKVISAGGGEEAMALVRAADYRISLVITDLMMPGMDGLQLADEIKILRPGIPILFASGYPERYLLESSKLRPGMRLLQKPFDATRLARELQSLLAPST